MHAGIAYWRFPLKLVAGKTFPASLAHGKPPILRTWPEAHGRAFRITGSLGRESTVHQRITITKDRQCGIMNAIDMLQIA